ncbi:hypothetical protein [Streptomyces sp. NBC_00091]|uniref:hypothetical protein n=1 Tax=Streptomyces sp. NBC_00091 TaxID=2975648 RepID=UPI00225086A5|nr:hypothetical protein [Streptomyces sp. NBC_00091]MCX5376024.1 hypothetical protein [Streptomyces sp. NBC_00091]
MTVDPAEPDTFREKFRDDLADEAPEADAAEQLTDIQPQEDDPLVGLDAGEAPEADAAEQARVVPLDEEDYR